MKAKQVLPIMACVTLVGPVLVIADLWVRVMERWTNIKGRQAGAIGIVMSCACLLSIVSLSNQTWAAAPVSGLDALLHWCLQKFPSSLAFTFYLHFDNFLLPKSICNFYRSTKILSVSRKLFKRKVP